MQSVSGWTIIVLLAVILIFSVAFTAGLVIWAIRYKRRKQANP
jgi:type II secretory pathway pseudopilin PulG